jgi:hypothetical protein
MRCDGRSVSAEYLGWYLNLPETRELIKKVRGGSAVPFIPMAALAGLEVPVPSMEVQNTIVCIDRLKLREQELLEEIRARRRELVDGSMRQAVLRECGAGGRRVAASDPSAVTSGGGRIADGR